MKKALLLIFSFIFFNCVSNEAKEVKEVNVLLIGNSLTYYNEMPRLLQEMMDETDPNINIEQITYPGFSLDAHLDNMIEESSTDNVRTRKKSEGEITETEKKIKEKAWDIIVMQTGGVSILIPEIRNQKIDPAIQKIMELSNTAAQYILFNTWTTKIEYPKKYCYPAAVVDKTAKAGEEFCSPEISSEEESLQLLEAGYMDLAEKNNMTLTNHANVFNNVQKNHSEVELLEDSMHPSKEGAFLSATIFYELITEKKAENLDYNAGLDDETANVLKKNAS